MVLKANGSVVKVSISDPDVPEIEYKILRYVMCNVIIPPLIQMCFSIESLCSLPKGKKVDILGVVKETGPPVNFVSKGGKDCVKRDIIVADKSLKEITVTLWGSCALRKGS